MASKHDPIRLGVAGLGRAFALSAPAIHLHPGIRLVAAAEPNQSHRDAFEASFLGKAYADVPDLVANPDLEAIYITTPHGMHKGHALAAIMAGKHVLIEKPMTVSLKDASTLISAAEEAGVSLVVGPSHSFDGPVALAEKMIKAGSIGRVRMIHAFYATDFLYRPRTKAELSTRNGGGAVLNQGIHQVDVVRRLAGSQALRVTARTGGAWDPERPVEGAYSMLIDFENGLFSSLTYSGNAHFDGDRLMDNVSELGMGKHNFTGGTREKLRLVEDEFQYKTSRGFSSIGNCRLSETHEHFGQVFIFGDDGDIRLTPRGIEISRDGKTEFHEAPFKSSRAEVFDALYSTIREKRPALQDGYWGRASLEICHALLKSEETGNTINLKFQIGKP